MLRSSSCFNSCLVYFWTENEKGLLRVIFLCAWVLRLSQSNPHTGLWKAVKKKFFKISSLRWSKTQTGSHGDSWRRLYSIGVILSFIPVSVACSRVDKWLWEAASHNHTRVISIFIIFSKHKLSDYLHVRRSEWNITVCCTCLLIHRLTQT